MSKPLVEISPLDAPHIPCEDGDPVRVTSRRGAIILRARVTETASPGGVFISLHFAEAAANMLTSDALDAPAKIPEYSVSAVRIERATESELEKTLAMT
ncbi:MAG: hypothetical protein HY327_09820 [Chloroflexi bacterium]|nr:hypothetical protein [Chloroflexota bacterium]